MHKNINPGSNCIKNINKTQLLINDNVTIRIKMSSKTEESTRIATVKSEVASPISTSTSRPTDQWVTKTTTLNPPTMAYTKGSYANIFTISNRYMNKKKDHKSKYCIMPTLPMSTRSY